MSQIIFEYAGNVCFTNDLKADVCNLLTSYGYDHVYKHCLNVAEESIKLADEFGEDTEKARIAGFLHDVSVIIPSDIQIKYAIPLKIDALPEEKAFPILLHQKYSRIMARDIFRISDDRILNAIECHTTLRANASKLDMILFLADKLRWDQNSSPPFTERINNGLKISLEAGSLRYIEYLLEDRARLKIVHPWLQAAYEDLKTGDFAGFLEQ